MPRRMVFAVVAVAAILASTSNAEPISRLLLDPPEDVKVNIAVLDKATDNAIVLNKHDFWVNYFRKESGGKLSFLPFFGGRTTKQSLLIHKDYIHYQEANNQRVGILIRLEADVETQESEVKIEKFQDIGAAAQLGIARGTIQVKVYGLDGPEIYKLRLEVDLNSVSLANIENQINDLHSKIMTDKTLVILPVVLPDATFNFRDEGRK